MGYDVHITRAAVWTDSAASPITVAEWDAFIAADPELAPDAANAAGFPHMALWRGDAWLDWRDGGVYTKNPDPALLRKMIALAAALGARVQGDDGEEYVGEPDVAAAFAPAPAFGGPASAAPARPWWRSLFGG